VNLLRYISSLSVDAIHNAIDQAVGAEKETFVDKSKIVQSVPCQPERQKKTNVIHQSDTTIIDQKILPQINDNLSQYDRMETSGRDLVWTKLKIKKNLVVLYIIDKAMWPMTAMKPQQSNAKLSGLFSWQPCHVQAL
jgi:hypothetical protein